jgi:DNA helicase-2/ATP-dependent DNA helicase PcrA
VNPSPVVERPSRLLEGLNPEQLAAVTLPAEPALILAGAGSGKTRVLTTRIAWLIQTGQLSPGGVMAVTFTNKAAKEMLTRLDAMLAIPVRGMWVGTFHGLCNRFLRAHWKLAALPQGFQILDTSDQLSAVKRVVKAMNLDEERHPPKQLTWAIASAKDDGLRAKDIEVKDEQSRVLVRVYEAYDAQCQREGVVDFAELMLRTYELMRDNQALREHYQRRFRHILVDEFQDTNRLQYAWLKMFAGPPEHGSAIFCVGDDDQSIYAFRGAQVGNMAAFEREYRVATVVKLERNYRSYGNILDAANELISRNSRRLGKNLRTEAGPGEPVRVHEATSDYAEAQWFIDEAQALHRDGTQRHEIALLYRSNAQSRVMESALFNAHIPYKVYGGLRFFERAEVKHALSYLRLIENPNDDTSFLRVVNFPARGIGARTVEQLQDAARASGRSLWQSVAAVAGKGGSNLAAFTARIDAMRAATRGLTLREIIVHMLEASGLVDFYKADREGHERLDNLEELINAAESFVTQEGFGRDAVALPLDERGTDAGGIFRGEAGKAEFNLPGAKPVETSERIDPTGEAGRASARLPALPEGGAGGGSNPVIGLPVAAKADTGLPDSESGEIQSPLAAFLTHAALEAGDNQAQAGQDAVQLMTIHSAKGLEFDCVFISGLEEGLFPHENSSSDLDSLEEERRLMYVAITRARKRLYLSFSQTRMLHGQTRYNVKSRFFDELPESALRWITPRNQAFGSGFAREYSAAWARGSGLHSIVGAGRSEPRAPTLAPQTSSHGLRPGQGVFHTKFGEGVIVTIEGSGDDARAQVNFGRHGMKWLALSIAKLTPVD